MTFGGDATMQPQLARKKGFGKVHEYLEDNELYSDWAFAIKAARR